MNKEELLFHLLRDKPVLSHFDLKKKYPKINIGELRLKIINYQVDKYGYQLDTNIDYVSKKEIARGLENARSRRRYKRNKEY